MGASWRRKAAVTAGVAVLGLVVLAGAGAGWHVSLGFDGGPGVEKNASTASTYVLTFDEGGAGWNFDEVRIFFEGDVGLSDASRQSVTFLENGAEVPVAGVTGGQLTQQEQDDTVTAWDRALRVELGEEMDGGGSYQVEIDGAVTPSSPGQYNLTLNTYISGDRQTNRDGPDRSVNNKTAT